MRNRNNRCNIKLSVRLSYPDDQAYLRTPRHDVLSDAGDYVGNNKEGKE